MDGWTYALSIYLRYDALVVRGKMGDFCLTELPLQCGTCHDQPSNFVARCPDGLLSHTMCRFVGKICLLWMFRRVVDWLVDLNRGRTFVTGAGKVFWYNLLTFLDMSSWRTQIGYSSSFESGSSDRLSFEWLLQGFQVRTLASWNATGLPTSTLKQVGMINSYFWLGWIFHLPNSWATETILKPTVASTSSPHKFSADHAHAPSHQVFVIVCVCGSGHRMP